jgi:predicted DCC family thiol-disulfide oxidoreductase YuxK
MGANIEVKEAVILFDGVCNLCNGAVNFIIDRDTQNTFKFASLQSDTARELLKDASIKPENLDSIVMIHDGQVFTKSAAAFRIANYLSGGWILLRIFSVLPLLITDGVYDIIAKNRYSWFGKRDVCRIPTPALKNRFLD